MFYVYEWYIKDTNEIIYVGKGSKLRFKVKKHNRFFNDMVNRFECESRIVKEFVSEKDAFEFEYLRINELKAKNQCVCNIRDGGFGGTTNWWNEDLRKRYSEKNVMKSQLQRKRMSENNPMKNCIISKKVAKSKSRPVIIGEQEFPSIKEAHLRLGVCSETVQEWCRKGINSKGQKCSYKYGEIRHYKPRVKGNQQPSISLNG